MENLTNAIVCVIAKEEKKTKYWQLALVRRESIVLKMYILIKTK